MNVVGFDVGKDSIVGARIDASMQVKEQFEVAITQQLLLSETVQTLTNCQRIDWRIPLRFGALLLGSRNSTSVTEPNNH